MSYVLLTVLLFTVHDMYDLPPAQNKLSSFQKTLYGDFNLDIMLLRPQGLQEEITGSIYSPSLM